MITTTRQEHLDWCKKRAMEYCERGDLTNALASISSDLGKHPETEGHAGIRIGVMMTVSGQLRSREEMAKFINGFN